MFFDRSWYNRAVVEPVMGFCTPAETVRFLRDTVMFEEMLINEGVRLFKFWFSVSREEQLRRVMSRARDGLKQWKVSGVDVRSLPLWDEYTEAKKVMFAATDTKASPWVVVKSDDKRRARINCMRYVLRSLEYDPAVAERVSKTNPKLIGPRRRAYTPRARSGSTRRGGKCSELLRGTRPTPVDSLSRGHDGAVAIKTLGRGGAVATRPVRPECPDVSSGCIEGPARLSLWGGADTTIGKKIACALRYAPVKHRRYSG